MLSVRKSQLKHADDSLLDISRQRRVVVGQEYANHVTVLPLKVGRLLTQ